jgi:NADP-dependent 3-hydroxy acid dehydrogenase YdfG
VAERITKNGGQAQAHELDVTDRAAVDALAAGLDRCDVLVANAGGAIGADPVATGSADDWRAMYEVNVVGTLNTVQALLPALIASGAGTIVLMGSTAGFTAYEGGGGYVAAKHGEHAIAGTLRLELFDQPVRVMEIAPGGEYHPVAGVGQPERRGGPDPATGSGDDGDGSLACVHGR